jgi:hypothetical protein
MKLAGVPESRHRSRWLAALATAAATAAAVTPAAAPFPVPDLLYRENGVLEMLSAAAWIFSTFASLLALRRCPDRASRLFALWTAWLAALAALRELDLHVYLNPQHLGSLGVRYRLDWWLDGRVSPAIKLGWILLLLGVAALTVYPPTRLCRPLLQLLRHGDPLLRLLIASAAFLALGFVIDDLLRPLRWVGTDTKQLLEETVETLGALLYGAGMVLQWRHPLAHRLALRRATAPPPSP